MAVKPLAANSYHLCAHPNCEEWIYYNGPGTGTLVVLKSRKAEKNITREMR